MFFQDFAYTLDALIFGTPCDGYILAKQTTRTLNLCQTTKHTINATEKSVENVNNETPFS